MPKNVELGAIGSTEALVGLGRFPETGNIMDLLLLSYPLREWFGSPVDHNLKTLIILTWKVASVAMPWPEATPIQSWWPLGLPVCHYQSPRHPRHQQDGLETGDPVVAASFSGFLQRAGRTGHVSDGILAGLCFALVSAFIGFMVFFGIVWRLLGHLVVFQRKTSVAACFSVDISRSDHRSDWGLLFPCTLLFSWRRMIRVRGH